MVLAVPPGTEHSKCQPSTMLATPTSCGNEDPSENIQLPQSRNSVPAANHRAQKTCKQKVCSGGFEHILYKTGDVPFSLTHRAWKDVSTGLAQPLFLPRAKCQTRAVALAPAVGLIRDSSTSKEGPAWCCSGDIHISEQQLLWTGCCLI